MGFGKQISHHLMTFYRPNNLLTNHAINKTELVRVYQLQFGNVIVHSYISLSN